MSSYDPNFVDSLYSGLEPSLIDSIIKAEQELLMEGPRSPATFLTSHLADMSMDDTPFLPAEDVFKPALFTDDQLSSSEGFVSQPLGPAEDAWELKYWSEM